VLCENVISEVVDLNVGRITKWRIQLLNRVRKDNPECVIVLVLFSQFPVSEIMSPGQDDFQCIVVLFFF
jgi:hypothetical protein